jgi:hypothetical protein
MNNATEKAFQMSTRTTLERGENQADKGGADQDRRHFLKRNLLALALAPTASLFGSKIVRAGRTARIIDDTPEVLNPSDPQAQALSYRAHSPKDGQSCGNCQLYTGREGEAVGPCAIFSYRVAASGEQLMVNVGGWCRAWAPRQPL